MKEKILIVEDEFIVANDLKRILSTAGYEVTGIASSVEKARALIAVKKPDWVLLDIVLKGSLTGIDLAWELTGMDIPFLFISANTNQSTLEAVKATQPYGFMVKPFRDTDLLVMLEIAQYRRGVEKNMSANSNHSQSAENIRIEGIIGKSDALQTVLKRVAVVGGSPDTSVLILGESGTGKERIAHSIHELSARRKMPFIVVNCAAIPAGLIESELFGHERGAFTGANTRRTGKFEQADGGTIFLDEVGELSLDAQVKLLRVLQEKEIQRLGSSQQVRLNVRVIAATNRNLEKEVSDQRFRLDLYYRLNVFPVMLPALRDRKEDIEDLVTHFVRKYALACKKNINGVAPVAMARLKEYDWPGNIRQLEHLIERSVLTAYGFEIAEVDVPAATKAPVSAIEKAIPTMTEMERTHIMNALSAANGRVSGPGGAADMLAIPATTLYSKIKRLGITSGYL